MICHECGCKIRTKQYKKSKIKPVGYKITTHITTLSGQKRLMRVSGTYESLEVAKNMIDYLKREG